MQQTQRPDAPRTLDDHPTRRSTTLWVIMLALALFVASQAIADGQAQSESIEPLAHGVEEQAEPSVPTLDDILLPLAFEASFNDESACHGGFFCEHDGDCDVACGLACGPTYSGTCVWSGIELMTGCLCEVANRT
ncbi:MAG: hypothetical protein AAGE94_04120 [Acidobacteriota bacterium]